MKKIKMVTLALCSLILTSCNSGPKNSNHTSFDPSSNTSISTTPPTPSTSPATPSTSIQPPSSTHIPTPPPSTIISTSTTSGAPRSIDHNIYPNGAKGDPLTDAVCLSLDIYVLEMFNQYADSLLIKCTTEKPSDDFTMLIDAGTNADGVNSVGPAIRDIAKSEIDLAVFTHGHDDHVGGFKRAINDNTSSVLIKNIFDFGYVYSTAGYKNYYSTYRDEYVKSRNTNYCTAIDALNDRVCSSTLYLAPDLTLDILDTGLYSDNPDKIITNSGANDSSLVSILRYKDFSFFLSGDLDKEDQLIAKNPGLAKTTLMKAGHHGSNTSNSSALLNILQPEAVFISTAAVAKTTSGVSSTGGAANDHPHPQAIVNFKKTPTIGDNIYLNMTMGTIKIALDTSTLDYTVTGSGAKRLIYDDKAAKALDEKNLKLEQTHFYNNVVINKTGKTLKESVIGLS